MSNFESIRVGLAGTPQDTTARPSQDAAIGANSSVYPALQGVPMSPFYVFDVAPLTKQTNNIALAQTPAGAGNLTLTAGTGVTTTTIKGVTVLAFDCARCVQITGVAGTVAVNITINGFDQYNQPMTQLILGPAGATTVTTLKAFQYISSIAVAGGTTNTVAVGTSDTIGLPMAVTSFNYLMPLCYNNAVITANTGFTAAVLTSPATNATGDVRGTYALQSASDGTKRLTAAIYIADSSTVTKAWGVTQA